MLLTELFQEKETPKRMRDEKLLRFEIWAILCHLLHWTTGINARGETWIFYSKVKIPIFSGSVRQGKMPKSLILRLSQEAILAELEKLDCNRKELSKGCKIAPHPTVGENAQNTRLNHIFENLKWNRFGTWNWSPGIKPSFSEAQTPVDAQNVAPEKQKVETSFLNERYLRASYATACHSKQTCGKISTVHLSHLDPHFRPSAMSAGKAIWTHEVGTMSVQQRYFVYFEISTKFHVIALAV